jgi:hypothetical protein
MANAQSQHDFQIGDAVLADFNGALIPGVVEAKQEDTILVRLSEPWMNEAGQQSDEAWLTPDKLNPAIAEETGEQERFPANPFTSLSVA